MTFASLLIMDRLTFVKFDFRKIVKYQARLTCI